MTNKKIPTNHKTVPKGETTCWKMKKATFPIPGTPIRNVTNKTAAKAKKASKAGPKSSRNMRSMFVTTHRLMSLYNSTSVATSDMAKGTAAAANHKTIKL